MALQKHAYTNKNTLYNVNCSLVLRTYANHAFLSIFSATVRYRPMLSLVRPSVYCHTGGSVKNGWIGLCNFHHTV